MEWLNLLHLEHYNGQRLPTDTHTGSSNITVLLVIQWHICMYTKSNQWAWYCKYVISSNLVTFILFAYWTSYVECKNTVVSRQHRDMKMECTTKLTVPRRPFWTQDTEQSAHSHASQRNHKAFPWHRSQQTTMHRTKPATETSHKRYTSDSNKIQLLTNLPKLLTKKLQNSFNCIFFWDNSAPASSTWNRPPTHFTNFRLLWTTVTSLFKYILLNKYLSTFHCYLWCACGFKTIHFVIYRNRVCLVCRAVGATENAGVEKVIRSKLQGWKMQEWKKREQIAGVENAGVSRMERQPEILLRQP